MFIGDRQCYDSKTSARRKRTSCGSTLTNCRCQCVFFSFSIRWRRTLNSAVQDAVAAVLAVLDDEKDDDVMDCWFAQPVCVAQTLVEVQHSEGRVATENQMLCTALDIMSQPLCSANHLDVIGSAMSKSALDACR